MQCVGGFNWWGTTSFLKMVGRAISNPSHLLKLVHGSDYSPLEKPDLTSAY